MRIPHPAFFLDFIRRKGGSGSFRYKNLFPSGLSPAFSRLDNYDVPRPAFFPVFRLRGGYFFFSNGRLKPKNAK